MADRQAYADQMERLAIGEVILSERTARDNASWDEMAGYYHPESDIDVSWFRGSGAEFVSRTRLQYEAMRKRPDEKDMLNFHEMGAALVVLNGDRAIAETACTLHGFFTLAGVRCKNTGFTRLLWRVRHLDGQWLIAGLRALYVRDYMAPCDPNDQIPLDQARLGRYRPSYKFMAYHLSDVGLQPRDDLAGVDRPETVIALRKGERDWLQQT